MEKFNRFLVVLAWKLFLLLILAAILSITYPYTSEWMPFKEAILGISSLKPGEKIGISKLGWSSERETIVDEKGVATFVDIPLGNWQVVKGGSEELRRLIIPIREYPPELIVGQVRGTYKKKDQRAPPRFDRPPV